MLNICVLNICKRHGPLKIWYVPAPLLPLVRKTPSPRRSQEGGALVSPGGEVWMIFAWEFGKSKRTHHPPPTKCHELSGSDHQKTYTHYPPLFSEFSSHFTIYKVVLTQILSHSIKFGLWITNSIQFWWCFGRSIKKTKKRQLWTRQQMRMENERLFQVFYRKFSISLLELSEF